MSKKCWSKPYCNLTHYGTLADNRRATVEIGERLHRLSMWSKSGDGFNPPVKWFESVEEAKKAGEEWANSL